MMKALRRRCGPTLALLLDLWGQARGSGNWLVFVVLLLTLGAAMLAAAGQVVLPWLIYPAL